MSISKIIGFILILHNSVLFAKVNRISAIRMNKGEVGRIYLSPGLGSIVAFPCDIETFTLGRAEDIGASVTPTNSKELILSVKSTFSSPTNMLVKCKRIKDRLVFDLIPTKSDNQDFLRIDLLYGSPQITPGNGLRLIESSDGKKVEKKPRNTKVVRIKKPVLISESQDQYSLETTIERKMNSRLKSKNDMKNEQNRQIDERERFKYKLEAKK